MHSLLRLDVAITAGSTGSAEHVRALCDRTPGSRSPPNSPTAQTELIEKCNKEKYAAGRNVRLILTILGTSARGLTCDIFAASRHNDKNEAHRRRRLHPTALPEDLVLKNKNK